MPCSNTFLCDLILKGLIILLGWLQKRGILEMFTIGVRLVLVIDVLSLIINKLYLLLHYKQLQRAKIKLSLSCLALAWSVSVCVCQEILLNNHTLYFLCKKVFICRKRSLCWEWCITQYKSNTINTININKNKMNQLEISLGTSVECLFIHCFQMKL